MPARACTIGFFALLLLGACRGEPAEDPREGERVAVATYGKAAGEVEALQRAFVRAWTENRSHDSVDALKAHGQSAILPALDRFLAALEALPCGTERLTAAHGPVVEAWRRFRPALVRYYERVTEANVDKRNIRLEQAWSRLGARIVAYREALSGYCAELGVTLAGPPMAGDTPGHTPTPGRTP